MLALLRLLGWVPDATEREKGLLTEIERLEHELQLAKKAHDLVELENEGLAEIVERMRTLVVADKAYLSDFAARYGIHPLQTKGEEQS